ncbi:MAG TPA: quinohemoprotein amine dehydrogenase subunit alpha [Vicinamibacterales bacterium]|nr:quinohemoprotein amine dehydrogenase subunit alpha [Vicinamibacterales bacterium]
MARRLRPGYALLVLLLPAWLAAAVTAKQTQPPAKAAPASDEEGIPITNETVVKACGTCHQPDAKHRLSRISYRRTTPEGWQETVRRMAALNKAPLDPDTARRVVKYLADHLGLAPEEAAPGAFEVERRMIDYKYEANADTDRVCSSCHSMGRVILQRRTKEDWELLVAMHRGWYPLVDFQVFRRTGPPRREPGPDGRPPDNRHPMDRVLDHLKSALPLSTPEWAAWSATMRSPRLEGTWALSGDEPGKGRIFGQMTIVASPSAPDEFTTEIRYTYARSGRAVTRSGRAIIYTGYQWRGRSTVGGDNETSLREVMTVDRDWRSIAGRWFTGGYDEIGLDVRLTRIERDTIVLGVDPPSLARSPAIQHVRLFGANLPESLSPGDLDFGPGVSVTQVSTVTPETIAAEVQVASDATVGSRDVFVGRASTRAAVAVYDRVDYIKVSPAWNMARVGGVVFPKMLARFEAVAYHNGADGKPDTGDDVNLGVVDAAWSIEEYTATFDDDDASFVGSIDAKTGLFTPAEDGPNPKRSGNRNNIGDVWVVAAYARDGNASPLRARAHLVVTVPLYMRWDFFTLEQR